MKKILLITAVAFGMNAMAQEVLTDITPKAYDWAHQEVGTRMNICHADALWNTDFTFSWQLGGSEYVEDGGCITANACSDPNDYAKGTAVVDLGGDIGKVMAINGAHSNAQEVLGFTTEASIDDKMQICIFTNPDNTPKDTWLRCKIVLNIFSNQISSSDGIINNMYWMSGDNDNLGSWFTENLISSGNFIQYDEEGDPITDDEENYIYDQNRWMTFVVDAWNRSDYVGYEKEETTSIDIPMKWKIWMPQAGLVNSTIFIKEIKFYAIEGANDKDTPPSCADHPHISFGPLEADTTPTGIETLTTNDQPTEGTFNLAGQRVENAQHGVFIVNGKKVIR